MERLPTELIVEICSYLCPHCCPCPDAENLLHAATTSSRSALLNLCLTSSRLRAIAQPILYHHIHILNENVKSCEDLLNTMIHRPDLARAVRYLIRTRFAPRLDHRDGPRPDVWRIREGEHNVFQQLLVRVPRIEVLSIELSSSYGLCLNPFEDLDTQPLSALRTVKIAHWRAYHGCDLSFSMDDFFPLAANINSLVLRFYDRVSTTLSLQNVTCLILEKCNLEINCLRRLLSSCGKLDTFAYDGVLSPRSGLSPDDVVPLLEEQGHNLTLRRLCLCCCDNKEGDDLLVSFSQLQILRLRFEEWWGVRGEDLQVEWLPPSLEEIALYDQDLSQGMNWIIEWKLEWISARASSGFFPRLKKIELNDLGPEAAQEKFPHLNITRLRTTHLQTDGPGWIGEWSTTPGGTPM
ncbi:hypothetical protein F4679DRAFT_552037 [Xylaria curta]|nr:hypothetical protein F4679DRAFT_552037 [Xylaria curta]